MRRVLLCSKYSSVTLKCEYIHKITQPSDSLLLLNVYYLFKILRISLIQCFLSIVPVKHLVLTEQNVVLQIKS